MQQAALQHRSAYGCRVGCQARSRFMRGTLIVRAMKDNDKPKQRPMAVFLSLFTPYKNLPPDGEIIPQSELTCDPQLNNCRTPSYVYEDKCGKCYGTGYVRGASSRRGARGGTLHTCLCCHGMGYVRITTTRYAPDTGGNDAAFTIARQQRLPGEVPAEHPGAAAGSTGTFFEGRHKKKPAQTPPRQHSSEPPHQPPPKAVHEEQPAPQKQQPANNIVPRPAVPAPSAPGQQARARAAVNPAQP
mmetsp:Transcript_27312/g.69523  ORF Transcript_27312/g.69523 Transcript_27312/m.69523 type:complete len:244 (-) Transcript_27312:602-1333(-)